MAGQIYVADGLGSGVWKKISTSDIAGLGGNPGSNNFRLMSDGAGNFRYVPDSAIGSLRIQGNTNSFSIATAGVGDLNDNSVYQLVSGSGAPFVAGVNYAVNASGDNLAVQISGIYQLSLSVSITQFPDVDTKVAIKYRINGSTLSAAKAIGSGALTTSADNMVITDIVPLSAGDIVQVVIAADKAGVIKVSELSLTVHMIRAT